MKRKGGRSEERNFVGYSSPAMWPGSFYFFCFLVSLLYSSQDFIFLFLRSVWFNGRKVRGGELKNFVMHLVQMEGRGGEERESNIFVFGWKEGEGF